MISITMDTLHIENASEDGLAPPKKIKKWNNLLATAFWSGAAGFLLICAAEAQIKYTVTELKIGNSREINPVAINNGGRVIGTYYWRDYSLHSFTYKAGVLNDLGTRAGYKNFATAINNWGQIAGYFDNGTTQVAYLRNPNGIITDLGALDKSTSTIPTAINDSGMIVGFSGPEVTSDTGAFVYQNGKMTKLGTYQGHPIHPIRINNGGQILATYGVDQSVFSPDRRTVILNPCGQMQDIGFPSQVSSPGGSVLGIDINDHGVVLALVTTVSTYYFRYSDGTFKEEAGDPQMDQTYAAMNNVGQIVGMESITTETIHGRLNAIIESHQRLSNLNDAIDPKTGFALSLAGDINDSGQICGWGYEGLTQVGFILTPVK